MSSLRLIMNGDDFGRARNINSAIIQAHEEGVLTSASLMVTGDAVGEAVAYAREHPSLAVGLHLALTDARGALPPSQAPHLLDARGWLPRHPAVAGVRCFFSPAVRSELRREIMAQFERYLETGLTPSHVDGHQLLHLHPAASATALPLAEHYGFQGIRLPRDDLRLALQLDPGRPAGKAAWASIYALLCHMAEQRLRGSSLAYADRVYGLLQSGRMHEGYVAGLLRRMPGAIRSAELYFHPSTQTWDEPYGPNPGDLAALLSPHVRRAIDERGAQLTQYAALAVGGHRRKACPGL